MSRVRGGNTRRMGAGSATPAGRARRRCSFRFGCAATQNARSSGGEAYLNSPRSSSFQLRTRCCRVGKPLADVQPHNARKVLLLAEQIAPNLQSHSVPSCGGLLLPHFDRRGRCWGAALVSLTAGVWWLLAGCETGTDVGRIKAAARREVATESLLAGCETESSDGLVGAGGAVVGGLLRRCGDTRTWVSDLKCRWVGVCWL